MQSLGRYQTKKIRLQAVAVGLKMQQLQRRLNCYPACFAVCAGRNGFNNHAATVHNIWHAHTSR